MSLDLGRLQKVKQRPGKIIAQCPACAETGGDAEGTHLAVFEDGRFACIKFQGDKEHRRRIFELVGLPPDHAPAALPAPVPARRKPQADAVNWPSCCAALLRNTNAQERLATWRGWTPDFVRTCAQAGVIGLHVGKISFPVAPNGGTITGAHYFTWPNTSAGKAKYMNGNNWPLIIGAASLAGAREVHIMEGQWDALSLLHSKNWTGEPLDKPFVVTRGTSINPALKELLAGVEQVTLWPQRDEPKQDGRPSPSEEWTARALALLPPTVTTIRRVDTPEPWKDWNDVLRARGTAETLATLKTAVRAAVTVEPLESPALSLTKSDLSDKTPSPVNLSDLSDYDTGDDAENDPFPLHVFAPVVGRMVTAAAAAALVPETLTACCALATISAAIGAGLEVKSGGSRRTRANIFLMPIAASATGKGQAHNMMVEPFLELERDAVREWEKDAAPEARAELALKTEEHSRIKKKKPEDSQARIEMRNELKRLEREMEELQPALHEPTWSTANVTKEELENLLALSPNETLASLSPEARGVVDVIAGRYHDGKSSDEDIYLSCFSGESVKVNRRGRKALLKRPCLTAMWMLQPDALQKLLGNVSMTESGLLPRFLICNTKAEPMQQPEVWPEIPAVVCASWGALIKTLTEEFRGRKEPAIIIATSEAEQIFREYYNSLVDDRKPGGRHHDVSIYVARWGEQAWRLSLVLHAALHGAGAGEQPLTPDIAGVAVELTQWFSRQQLAILAAGRSERRAERLERIKTVLSSQPESRANMRVLQRSHGIERAEIETLAREFPHVLRVEIEKTGEAGRPSVVVSLVSAPNTKESGHRKGQARPTSTK